ncbi:hypothetical protein GGR57DRAFT_228578, partial [Xylariaceae sp. FL1272]
LPSPSYQVQLTNEQQLEYLILLSRDFPDHWVCSVCMSMHRMSLDDLPTNIAGRTCSLEKTTQLREKIGLNVRGDDRVPFKVDYRHVQLALKHIRIRDESYFQYLKLVMSPFERGWKSAKGDLTWKFQSRAQISVGGRNEAGTLDNDLRFIVRW